MAGPVGGLVGSVIGGIVGGRVICTELVRQKKMSRELLRLDREFSTYLHPWVVRGYWMWAIPYVRLMNRADRIGSIETAIARPIAMWRAQEIAFIMGKRAKPHWGGKFVRLVGESASFALYAVAKLVKGQAPDAAR